MKIRDRIKEFKRVPASQLLPNPKNWRTHSDDQKDVMRGLLAEIGIAGAVIAYETPEGLRLIDGHLRTEQIANNVKIPTLILDVNDEEANKILATFDPVSAMASRDDDLFRNLLNDIEFENAAVEQMIHDMLNDGETEDNEPQEGLTDPDEVPEPPAEPITKPGDLWILGDHRLLCGDSTNADDVKRLMGGEKARSAVTDPPFAIMGSSTGAKNDPSLIRPFFRLFWGALRMSGAFDVYMFCDWRSFPTIHQEANGWDIKDVIVWDKKSGGLGNPYRRRHEFIVFARPATSDKRMMGNVIGGCSITDDDVWQCSRVSDKEHNAQKPLEIIARCIENSTSATEIVFEPCGGSGTTLIAAEQLGRKCYGMEISPQYRDVIVTRWEKFTGRKAERAAK